MAIQQSLLFWVTLAKRAAWKAHLLGLDTPGTTTDQFQRANFAPPSSGGLTVYDTPPELELFDDEAVSSTLSTAENAVSKKIIAAKKH